MTSAERWGMMEWVITACAVIFVCAFSLSALTTKPRIGVDESITIDIAHHIAEKGVLNISTAPGVYPSRPYTIAATGYAVTYPLAWFFNVFGFGFVQARIYMLCWIAIFLASVLYVVDELFGKYAALFALMFMVTFATFYDIGRTAMGELPGFIFFLWGTHVLARARAGFYFRAKQNSYLLAGLLIGLAVATKPSLYLSLVVVVVIYFLTERRVIALRSMMLVALGAALVLFVWVYSIFPYFWQVATWREAYGFLANPFGRPLLVNMWYSLRVLPQSSTIWYFAVIAVCVAWMFVHNKGRELSNEAHAFVKIALLYSVFGLFYFLRSPGWFRYLFAMELMLLILWYPAFCHLVRSLKNRLPKQKHIGKHVVLGIAAFMVVGQLAQLLFFSAILESPAPQEVSAYVLERLGDTKTVGVIDNQQIAALMPIDRRYQQFWWTGVGLVGKNPLAYDRAELPDYLVFEKRTQDEFVLPYQDVLDQYYTQDTLIFRTYYVFKKK